MNRCFQLAKKGAGHVSPNPLVGSVVVHNGKIIGEGFHRKFGGHHAEPNAINSISDKSLLPQSTLYVNLEPCNHFGKTPPCADLVVQSGFKRVVISNTDPNPKVNSTRIQKIKNAGIDVTVGVLESEGRVINKRFFCAQEKKRPYIMLKWAQTADGFINHLPNENKKPLKISSRNNQQLVHNWRSKEDAIMIGWKTLLNDKPKLNTRLVEGKNPLPIILALGTETPDTARLIPFESYILISTINPVSLPNQGRWLQSKKSLTETLSPLLNLGLNSILVEGGLKTHELFINQCLWDEIRIYSSEQKINVGIPSPKLNLCTTNTIPLPTQNKVTIFNTEN